METSVDADYVRGLVDGDPTVARHFASHFGRLLYIKLRRRMGRSADIDDIRQETFARVLKALRRGPGLRNGECLGGFVNAVCDNVLHEQRRKWKREPQPIEAPDDIADGHASAVTELVRGELVGQVRRVLATMSERDRAILRALLSDAADRASVCAEYNIDRDYLRVLLHRAKERFREHFEADRVGNAGGSFDSSPRRNGGPPAARGIS